MKKLITNILLLLFVLLFISCEKHDNTTTKVDNDINELTFKSIGWEVTFSAGHKWINCGGSCYTWGGLYTHLPCWDFGKECTHTIGFSIFKDSDFFQVNDLDKKFDTEVTLLFETADSVFTFPARSFSYEEGNVQYWLNIPKQIVKTTNNSENIFSLRDIYFSRSKPLLTNKI